MDMMVVIVLIAYLIFMVTLVQRKQDMSIANFTWGGGCLLLAWYTLLTTKTYYPRQLLATTLVTVWALRLIIHLYMRYTGKDPRFQTWRQLGGVKAIIMNIIYIFGPQVVLMLVMTLPVVFINTRNNPHLNGLDFLGLAIWLFGFCFEAISDYQLFVFMHNAVNKGKLMRYGLWRYSRHPNYFGEVTLWWGFFLIALSIPGGLIAIITPLTIMTLLLFFTGIPWTEKALENNPEWPEYKRSTSIFIPWFVKK